MNAVDPNVFRKMITSLNSQGFKIDSVNHARPWGGFLVINEAESDFFIKTFFSNTNEEDIKIGGKLSPKILIVAPGKRLSWQYHFRRSEIWKVIEGPVGIVRSETDEEGDIITCKTGDVIKFQKGERHRLVGLKTVGIIAEIWQHTDVNFPSDEMDIICLQDDHGRN
jgi:mannose-6-phosphate isomerase-like protein (cupin superfamily)